MSYDGSTGIANGSAILPQAEGCEDRDYWTFDMVEARLVEALRVARRMPDREVGWLSVRAFWPSIVRERALGDFDARGYLGTTDDAPAPRIPLTAAEIGRMEETESWLGRFLEEGERPLVVLALGWLAAGRRIGWRRIRTILAAQVGEGALAKRYSLAIAAIACGLSGKGSAATAEMVRQHRAKAARDALGGTGWTSPERRRGRRRRAEYVITYAD